MLGLNVGLDPFCFGLHHSNELDARHFELFFTTLFKERQYLFAGKFGINRQTAIGKIDHRIYASTAVYRTLHFKHVRGKKICQQTLQAGLAELTAKMWKLK